MRRAVVILAAFAFLASAPAALADGATYFSQGGMGVRASDGATRFVAVPTGGWTAIERIAVHGGGVQGWAMLAGGWGIPAPAVSRAEGLTRDGKRLIVQTAGLGAPSRFAVIDTRTLRVADRFSLKGSFSYDALSPDGSTLYLIEHVDAANAGRYVVRAYDLRTHELQPGRIADKTQLGWVMEGSAVTRATSGDGRWVYTLYQRPGGYPFVHALDTVNGVAHCTGLPWSGDQTPLWNLRLSVVGDGKTIALNWRSGKPWLTLDRTTWRLTHVTAAGGSPWRRLGVVAGSAALLTLACAAFVVARRRQPREPEPVAL